MHAALARQKQQRYQELGNNIQQVFDPVPNGGNEEDLCSVCGEDAITSLIKEDGSAGDVRICSLCRSMIEELGEKLPGKGSSDSLLPTHPISVCRTASQVLQDFGLRFQFLQNNNETVNMDCEHLTIWALEDPLDDQFPGSNIPGSTSLKLFGEPGSLIPLMSCKVMSKEGETPGSAPHGCR